MRNNTCKIYTHKTAIISTLILISLLPSSAINAWTLFPRTVFEAAPFEGKIVDVETGQPISNAVVYINWPRMTSTFAGSNPIGTVEAREAVTDSSGYYKMPGWKKSKKEAGKGWFSKSRPEMVVYAQGYWPELLHNQIRSDDTLARNEVWKSDWDGKTIELKPMHSEGWNTAEQWQKYNDSIDSIFRVAYSEPCGWKKVPYSLIARNRLLKIHSQKAYPYLSHKTKGTGPIAEIVEKKDDCRVNPIKFFNQHGMTREELEECCSDDPTKRTGYKNRPQLVPVYTFPAEPEAANSSGDER